ncbi:MAG: HDOD domain-containing protein [Candidatus Zixiibacteriota bacterium]
MATCDTPTVVTMPEHSGALTMEQVVAGLGAYPLPQTGVIPVLMRMTANLNTNLDDVARILASDPALAAKTVHLSNSAFYGQERAIASLRDAIRILGFQTVRTLAVAASAYSIFRREQERELEQDLWRHSLAVGLAARLIARRAGSHHVEEEIFLAGLLHDIAKLVLLQVHGDIYKPILREAIESQSGHLIVENARLGFTHADLGAVILDQWGFPSRIIGVVRRYHIPDLPYFVRERHGIEKGDFALPHILCFAHEMANNLGYGFLEQTDVDLLSLPSAEVLGINESLLHDLSRELVLRYFEEQGFYSMSNRADDTEGPPVGVPRE